MTETERALVVKQIEDRVTEVLDREHAAFAPLMYKTLYGRGLRIGTIDQDIRRILK